VIEGFITQRQFGDLVGITEPAVSDLVKRGVLKANVSGHGWLLAYCQHLREHAAGRAGTLAESRAALDNERRIEIAMRNAVKRKEYAPVSAIAEVLAKVGRQSAGILEALTPAIRLRWPEVSSEQLRLVEGEVAKARNRIAAISLDDLVDKDEQEGAG
jgi:terminase small subunit / prophage DNA-packing protein